MRVSFGETVKHCSAPQHFLNFFPLAQGAWIVAAHTSGLKIKRRLPEPPETVYDICGGECGANLMKQTAYCLFETRWGWCGIAWRERGESVAGPAVVAFQLPEATAERAEARIARTFRASRSTRPPPEVAEVIERVRKHLEGENQDFRDVAVDFGAAEGFARRVWEAARQIPAGETRTYGELAKALRQPGAARAVGRALATNPIPLIIPCHRVVATAGRLGGFSAPGGRSAKIRLLEIERALPQRFLWIA